MGDKEVSLPSAPAFQADKYYDPMMGRQIGNYDWLMSGLTGQSFNGGGGSFGGAGASGSWDSSSIGQATNISPEISRLSQQYAQSQLDPAFRRNRQDTINTLEANNQMTGSTTASALGNLDADYMASLTGMQAQYGLADVERALNNRVQLYGQGLNLGQSITGYSLENQNQTNQFALQNYENQVAQAMMNQDKGGSWLTGGLTGAASGAVGGAVIGSIVPGVGTLAGGLVGGYLGGLGGAAMGSMGSSNSQVMSSTMQTAGMLGGYGRQGSIFSPTGRESISSPLNSYTAGSSYGGYPMSSYGMAGGLGGY